MRLWNVIVLLLLCLCPPLARAADAAPAGAGRESRAIMDEDFLWLTPRQADETLKRIKEAGFNVFIPCVWHGRGVTWPSEVVSYKEPRWAKVWKPNVDPLAYLIKKAHAMGIEVHPWFTVTLKQRDFYSSFAPPGMPAKTFNIHDARFRDLMESIVLEVATRYDIDGVNLDYIRSMGVCKTGSCKADYQKFSAGRDLDIDSITHRVDDDARERITRWNRRSVEAFVASLGKKLRAQKPGIVFSVDTQPGLKELEFQGADSIAWANKGLIDVIFHMEYVPYPKLRRGMIRKAQEALQDPDKLVIMVGNYEKDPRDKTAVWPRDARQVAELLDFSRRAGSRTNGVALYEYAYLSDSQIDALSRGPFKSPAVAAWGGKPKAVLSLQP